MKCYSRFILLSLLLFPSSVVSVEQADSARMELVKRMDKRLEKIDYCIKDSDNYLAKVNDKGNSYRRIFTVAVCLEFYDQLHEQGKLKQY